MNVLTVERRASILLVVVALATACAKGGSDSSTGDDASGTDAPADVPTLGDAISDGGVDAAAPSACPPCVTDADCKGGAVCAQFGGDIYCAPPCPKGDECASDRACASVTSYAGDQIDVCVPRGDVCGAPPGPDAGADTASPSDSGSTGGDTGGGTVDHCGSLVGPAVTAGCTCAAGHTCQANGCYGGWWCDSATDKCHAPPSSATCGPPDTGTVADTGAPTGDAGAPTGSVGPFGGTVSKLYFAVVGDTRPPVINDTKGYPVTIIDRIYSDLAATSPVPTFAVSTGDYCFATASGSESGPQMDMYLSARAKFPNAWFPALGNHECTGAVTSNCGAGAADGVTVNYSNFVTKMLGPIAKSEPYYVVKINAADGSWTSKLVFVAANAWSTAQQTWLETTLSEPTTYTFVIRHEPAAASTAPGVSPSETIMKAHPYTLSIVGHTHLYARKSQREIVIGNGGAPLTGTGNFGYAILQQRADGAIRVDMHDYLTNAVDPAFGFAVKPDGSAAP